MRKVPISGGPHTGKTTVLNALRAEYPEAFFVDEPAERVIADELRKEEESQSYVGRFPWNSYPEFAPLVVEESVRLEAALPAEADLVFQDRSLVDNIGYCRLKGFEDIIPDVEKLIRAAQYTIAFFCEPVGTYTPTVIRRETPQEAQETHTHLSRAYEESGLLVVHLPGVSVEERLTIIRETLNLI